MNNQVNNSTPWKYVCIMVVSIALLVSAFFLIDKAIDKHYSSPVQQTEFIDNNPDITLEERLRLHDEAVFYQQAEQLYYEMPSELLSLILQKIGANATVIDIYLEYERNKSYYFSEMISINTDALFDWPGVDTVDRMEIRTITKEPAPKEKTRIPVIPADSLYCD